MSSSETHNRICFPPIPWNLVNSVRTVCSTVIDTEKHSEDIEIFSNIRRGVELYINAADRLRHKEFNRDKLEALNLTETQNVLGSLNISSENNPSIGELLAYRRVNKEQKIVEVFNGLDSIIMHGAKVLENISSGVYRNLEEQSKIAIANFNTKFAEFKKQVTDMLDNIAIFDNLKDKVEQIAQRWKFELKVFPEA